jgi:type IV pilus assembly protein PilA
MIVIVIVGILSAVALPNFLNQTTKAKTTEGKTLSSAFLKQYHAESMIGTTEAEAFADDADNCPVATDNFTFDCTTTYGTITATGQNGLSGTLVMAVSSDGDITETNTIE